MPVGTLTFYTVCTGPWQNMTGDSPCDAKHRLPARRAVLIWPKWHAAGLGMGRCWPGMSVVL